MEEEALREKMPTQAQEYVLRIKEVLTQIENNLKPILRNRITESAKTPEPISSQLLLALREVVEKAENLRDSIDL